MLLFPVTSLYAGLSGLLYTALTWGVIAIRRKYSISYGDGGNPLLQRRIAAHSNASQYLPLLLLFLALLEGAESTSAWLLHLWGALTFLGRASHAYTVAFEGSPLIFRKLGMLMTISTMILVSVQLLWKAVHTMTQEPEQSEPVY